jgi:hypothetical protein
VELVEDPEQKNDDKVADGEVRLLCAVISDVALVCPLIGGVRRQSR